MAKVSTKAASENLTMRRSEIISELVKNYGLVVDITLVKSSQNKANKITRIPQKWLEAMKNEPILQAHSATKDKIDANQILEIHLHSEYLGVKQTMYFIRRVASSTSEKKKKI